MTSLFVLFAGTLALLLVIDRFRPTEQYLPVRIEDDRKRRR